MARPREGAALSPKADTQGLPIARRRGSRVRILVAGLGNLLLADDGVGVHAIRHWQEDKGQSAGVVSVEVGTAVLDALHLFTWADRVLAIDAMEAGGPPGTIYRADISVIEERPASASLHALDLVAALRFLPAGRRPAVTVLGVEPGCIAFNLQLSSEVQAALPEVLRSMRETVSSWRKDTFPGA